MASGLPLEDIYQGRVLNLAHRGARYHGPENTLAAYRRAMDVGAHGVELDVMLTADDAPVCIHDFVVDKTTDGTGRVRDLLLAALRELDAGSHFDAQFAGERIPTFDEALETLGPSAVVNIELKQQTLRTDGLEARTLEVIRRHDAERRVIVSSFNPFALRRMRRLAPQIAIGYLFAPDQPWLYRSGWLMWGVRHQARHPYHEMITPEFAARLHRLGWRVNTWTVNEPERMAYLREVGVDAIITDRPDLLREALAAA